MFSTRINSLQNTLSQTQSYLISNQYDLYYLTGFETLTPDEREAFLVITQTQAHLFLSSFSENEPIEDITQHQGSIVQNIQHELPDIFKKHQLEQLFFDPQSLFFSEHAFFQKSMTSSQFEPWTKNPVMNLRLIKDNTEIESITKANHVTHQALKTTLADLQVGMSETRVRQMFEQACRQQGVEQFAFPTIVAFGDHTALPHHQPASSRQLMLNEPVLIDCGAKWGHYCADVTRTVWFGDRQSEEFLKIENIIQEAYDQATSSLILRPQPEGQLSNQQTTITASHVDQAARDVITKAGFARQFIHTTGHGVGLYIHESPSLNWKNEEPLAPGMVITIEPGIYLEGKFGYRFENSVLLNQDTVQELL